MFLFDGWEPLIKARQAIGLENWKKLEAVADKVKGKTSKDITFTSSHPMYQGSPVKHTLGSMTGNMHFLQGYVSPGFHVSPYHWQLVDPYMEDDEAASKEHPSRVDLWNRTGLPVEAEGDLADGQPHKAFKEKAKAQKEEQDFKKEAVFAGSGYGRYIGIPSMGVVFGILDKRLYDWSLVRNSFLSAVNPEFYQAMEAAQEDTLDDDIFIDKSFQSFIVKKAIDSMGDFSSEVYSLVKSSFPKPGSIINLDNCYGVVTSSSIDFYTPEGGIATIDVFDKSITSLDLCYTDSSLHPSILLNFMENYLDISRVKT